jgi:hypothetical protein
MDIPTKNDAIKEFYQDFKSLCWIIFDGLNKYANRQNWKFQL